MPKFIIQFLMYLILSQSLTAEGAELYFWPTKIFITSDPLSSGVLYAWPEFSVLLQSKKNEKYIPAAIDSTLAKQLSQIFNSDENSPIRIVYNASSSSWGLEIPGGSRLRKQNATLLAPMTKKFTECLSTLTDDERDLMEDVIAFPLSVITGGRVQLTQEHYATAASMFARLKTNRCENGQGLVSETLQKKTEEMLAMLLCGSAQTILLPIELMAQTMLFHDLLFSNQGIWVRATMAIMKGFITERLAKMPLFDDKTPFQKDYDNFLDFVFTTRQMNNLTKQHYLSIARALSFHTIADAFKSMPLKKLTENGQLTFITLHVSDQHSTLIRNGEVL